MPKAYEAQSETLQRSNIVGDELEDLVKDILRKNSYAFEPDRNKRVYIQYSKESPRACLEQDIVLPNSKKLETIISVTHSDPTRTPGHSNENKLQGKLGELYLLKTLEPSIRAIMVMGGPEEKWLSYVRHAFEIFFDRVVPVWKVDFENELISALSCTLRNENFWKTEKKRRQNISLSSDVSVAPAISLRREFYETVIRQNLGISHPREISNPVLRLMAKRAFANRGKFWQHLSRSRYDAIWQERSFFIPTEAFMEVMLSHKDLHFEGSLGKDCAVPNLLHRLGMKQTKMSEDFVLYSERYARPVYVQCKASGGGTTGHGKNIGNRATEQIGRSLLYRTEIKNGKACSTKKNFIWIFVLDNNWRLPVSFPVKYIQLLQIAGCDRIFKSIDLADESYNPDYGCSLLRYLEDDLQCRKSHASKLNTWIAS